MDLEVPFESICQLFPELVLHSLQLFIEDKCSLVLPKVDLSVVASLSKYTGNIRRIITRYLLEVVA